MQIDDAEGIWWEGMGSSAAAEGQLWRGARMVHRGRGEREGMLFGHRCREAEEASGYSLLMEGIGPAISTWFSGYKEI